MADPAIKLFGKTIPLPDIPPAGSSASTAAPSCSQPDDVMPQELPSNITDDGIAKDIVDNNDIALVEADVSEDVVTPMEKNSEKGEQEGNACHVSQSGVSSQGSERACQDVSLGATDNHEASSGADEKAGTAPSKPEDEKTEASASQETAPKKPDKILPCPRCNSMDTKFCYYNNYNVNQPRHFCKKCQRYWTAGGTMRNVPVGAGRRKNKSSATHYRHITVPEVLQTARQDIPNGVHPGLQANGTVLSFGSDSPLCDSMTSILNLAEKTMMTCATNGFQKPEELKIPIHLVPVEPGGSQSDGLISKDDASKAAQKEPAAQKCLPFPQIPCYPGAAWPYPWNSAQWSPPMAAPPFCPNGVPLPFYPAPYWGCTVPGTWSIPWVAQPSPSNQSNPSSGPNSPTLGKHSRDGNMLTSTSSEEKEAEDKSSEPSLWIPKTLRIDDPGEAAKSSIWTTLGIKNGEKSDSIGRGSGLFKAFQSKSNEGKPNLETSSVLEANPAALSRSQNFQENS